ncbi:hypothetical protein RJ641_024377 [Dillenia turbinata]|uniref:Uncharacterized protein n=1 Tax=Dillenia turbinata TaxID=194707 RepID=A0AAN8YR78_9MAGN
MEDKVIEVEKKKLTSQCHSSHFTSPSSSPSASSSPAPTSFRRINIPSQYLIAEPVKAHPLVHVDDLRTFYVGFQICAIPLELPTGKRQKNTTSTSFSSSGSAFFNLLIVSTRKALRPLLHSSY